VGGEENGEGRGARLRRVRCGGVGTTTVPRQQWTVHHGKRVKEREMRQCCSPLVKVRAICGRRLNARAGVAV